MREAASRLNGAGPRPPGGGLGPTWLPYLRQPGRTGWCQLLFCRL